MATDDIGGDEGDVDDVDDEGSATERTKAELKRTRDRLGEGAGRAVREFDDGIVDLLAWLLDTETRARIYVYLREHPECTSDEIAEGTGLYPSTVREALAELHEEGTVSRSKREADGAGNNPYEYEAIAPSELVRGVVGDVQAELNAVFTLDSRLGGDTPDDDAADPVQISVAAPDADDDVTDDATGGTTDDAADRRRPDADTA
jgi:predicted transcriptional regulator